MTMHWRIVKSLKTKSLDERLQSKLRKVINSRAIVNRIKTRSVTKKQLNEQFIEANIDILQETLKACNIVSSNRILAEPGTSYRPRSRPLLSSTRGDPLEDLILANLSDSDDVNDLTAIELVVNSSQGELLQTEISDPDTIEEDFNILPDPVIPDSPVLQPVELIEPSAEQEQLIAEISNHQLSLPPKKIRKEVWQVARSLSSSKSPTRIAAALHLIADEASNATVESPPTPTTSESLSNSISLPATPITPTMSAADAAIAAEATACGDVYVEATLAWEEIIDVDLTKLPTIAIEQHAKDSDEQKRKLTAAYLKARKLPPDKLVEFEDAQLLLDLKKKFLDFRDRAWKLMGENQTLGLAAGPVIFPGATAATNAASRTNSRGTNFSTPEDILSDRVTARKLILINAADEIQERLARLANRHPDSTPLFTDLEAKVDMAATEAKESLAELKELNSAATKVGDAD